MRFHVHGILETDSTSRRIVNFFPAEVLVDLDEDAQRLRLYPQAGPGRIPLQESIDHPELPLREGGMTIGGEYVRLIFLGRNSSGGSKNQEDNLVFALKDEEGAERLKRTFAGRG